MQRLVLQVAGRGGGGGPVPPIPAIDAAALIALAAADRRERLVVRETRERASQRGGSYARRHSAR